MAFLLYPSRRSRLPQNHRFVLGAAHSAVLDKLLA
jgi:hypothetical protein